MTNFSVRWTGTILPPASGRYTFYIDGDNQAKVWVQSELLLEKTAPERKQISRKLKLSGNQPVDIKIEYVHGAGNASLHLSWSGPGLSKQILLPVNAAGKTGTNP